MANSIFQPKWVNSTKLVRFKQLEHFFSGKDVLDIGCAVGYKKEDWVHKKIKTQAKSILGMDLDEGSVKEIKDMGYNVIQGDAQTFDLQATFDIVHAGELIEHLENPGNFLRSAKKHLREDGILIISTPNALRISNFIYAATGGLRVNREHTCWFCEYTLRTLLDRCGYEILSVGYIKHQTVNPIRKILLKIRSLVLPERVAWNTVYITAKSKKN